MKAIRKLAPILGATSLAVAILAGGQASAQGTGSVKGDGKDLVMFTMTASNVYGANQINGAEKEAGELGYKLRFSRTTSRSRSRTSRSSNTSPAAPSRAAIIFWPWVADAAINDVRQLSKVGPRDPDHPGAERAVVALRQGLFAGANQILIGETLGQMMLKARDAAKAAGMKFKSDERQSLVFQHPEGEKTGIERWKGFEEATEERPVQHHPREYGANGPETGYEIGSQVIPGTRAGLDFLFVSNQQAANGIIRALKENGIKPGKDVYIVSGDCSGSLDAVKNGETFGTGLQPGAIEGSLGGPHRGASTSPPEGRGRCAAVSRPSPSARRSTTATGEAELHAARAGNRRRRHRTRRSGATRPTRSARADHPPRIEMCGAQRICRAATLRSRNRRAARDSRLTVRLVEALRAAAGADRVDFELRPGEVMALLGENGAGKSLWSRCSSGLVDPDAGDDRDRRHAGRACTRAPARRRRGSRSFIRNTAPFRR